MSAKRPTYLDYNATTPVDPRVLEAMLPWFSERFGNAASATHDFGWEAAQAVKMARTQTANLIGAKDDEITFTSGATEAINLAVQGVAYRYHVRGRHLVTLSTEHKAVLDCHEYLKSLDFEVSYVNVDKHGRVDLDKVQDALRDDTVLLSAMLVNNETGVLQDLQSISDIARGKGVIFFTDATQAIGKMPIDVDDFGIDLLALSAHKFYGPKGVGALYTRSRHPRVSLQALLHGGGHENGLRSGTLNVPGIVGLGKAAELAVANMMEEKKRIENQRNKLESNLLQIDESFLNGDPLRRLHNTSNIGFASIRGNDLIKSIRKLAVSSGSACTSAIPAPSHVLAAMGLDEELAYSSIRFSLGRFTTNEEIDFAIDYMKTLIAEIQQSN